MPDVIPVSTIQSSSPFHAVTMQEVKISTDLNDREIYKQGGGMVNGNWVDNYALTSVGLAKLMNAAGIEEVRSARTDDRSHPYVCDWQFVAKWVQPDSTTLTCSEDYQFDVRDWVDIGNGQQVYSARFAEAVFSERASLVQKEFKAQIGSLTGEAKAAKTDQIFSGLPPEKQKEITERAEEKALRSLIQMRKFVVQRAQTGAMLRAIRKMLNLKQSYSMQELKEPFRIPRSRYDWERMDAVLGKEVSSELRQLQALQILGISPEAFKNFRQLPAPQTHTATDAVEGVFSEDTKVEVAAAVPAFAEKVIATNPEEPVLADDEMLFLGDVVKKAATLGLAATTDKVKNWITTHIVGAFESKKHYLNHIDDHFGVQSAVNLTYEQIWALYLHKHKGVAYPPQWAGKKGKKEAKPKAGEKPVDQTMTLTKRIEALSMTGLYAYFQNELRLGDVEQDAKAASVMTELCNLVQQGAYTVALESDEKEMYDMVKTALEAK